MHLPDALTPLRLRQFRLYFSARFISLLGSALAPIAVAFAVLDLTGSATAIGAVIAARTIPMIALMLVGGVVADRLSRSTVLQVSHWLSAGTQGCVAVLLLTGTAELWMVILIEALNGAFNAFTFPAMEGIVPQVAPATHLQQANAMLGFARSGTAILGPAVGGILVATVGSGWAVAIDALTWAVAALLLSGVRLPRTVDAAAQSGRSVGRDLLEGWSAFTSMTWVWVVVTAFGVLNAIHAGAIFTLGPAIAVDTVGKAGWGWCLSAEAVGTLAMSLVMLHWHPRFPIRVGMIGMCALTGPIFALGIDPELGMLIVLFFLAGVGMEVFGIGWVTAIHEHVPQRLMSRVFSYDMLGSIVAIPVGAVVFGPLAEAFGTERVLVVAGVVFLLVALSTLLSRSVRGLERVGHSLDETPARS
jgi:MFS family permease